MNFYLPDPIRSLMAVAAAAILVVSAAAAAEAIYFTHAGDFEQSGVTPEMWAQIDAGSLSTIHRGPVPSDTQQIVFSTSPDVTPSTEAIAAAIEGWFHAVGEAGAIGGIPG